MRGSLCSYSGSASSAAKMTGEPAVASCPGRSRGGHGGRAAAVAHYGEEFAAFSAFNRGPGGDGEPHGDGGPAGKVVSGIRIPTQNSSEAGAEGKKAARSRSSTELPGPRPLLPRPADERGPAHGPRKRTSPTASAAIQVRLLEHHLHPHLPQHDPNLTPHPDQRDRQPLALWPRRHLPRELRRRLQLPHAPNSSTSQAPVLMKIFRRPPQRHHAESQPTRTRFRSKSPAVFQMRRLNSARLKNTRGRNNAPGRSRGRSDTLPSRRGQEAR